MPVFAVLRSFVMYVETIRENIATMRRIL